MIGIAQMFLIGCYGVALATPPLLGVVYLLDRRVQKNKQLLQEIDKNSSNSQNSS
jgi:hypothetical protein